MNVMNSRMQWRKQSQTCVGTINIPFEKDVTSKKVGLREKLQKLISAPEVDIPKSNIDRAITSYLLDLKKIRNKQLLWI